jgi:hypothetical protein
MTLGLFDSTIGFDRLSKQLQEKKIGSLRKSSGDLSISVSATRHRKTREARAKQESKHALAHDEGTRRPSLNRKTAKAFAIR